MNYNSQAFKDAVSKTTEIIPYTWQGLSDADKKNFKSVGPWELFTNQEVGVRWDASWNLSGWIQNAKFNWDFIGIPGGSQAIVFDAMVVSKTSPNLEQAYDFAKWMTFSSQAYQKRAEIAKAAGAGLNLPIAMDANSVALFKSFVDKPGINKALDNLNNSLLESLAKVIPGYIQASTSAIIRMSPSVGCLIMLPPACSSLRTIPQNWKSSPTKLCRMQQQP
jgi:ABC-type glycerol-3-phosphate transport system substrate-binding protein